MNVHVLGFRHKNLSITDRLIKGFESKGVDCSFEKRADFVIALDPGFYEQGLQYDCFKIFNILDVPIHLLDKLPINKIKNELKNCDSITSISEFTKSQCKKYYGFDSEVTYSPISPVKNFSYKKVIPFLYVGRANDPNKRFSLVKEALIKLGISQQNLVVCGPEDPMFGNYQGIVSDHDLNYIYNKSKFLLFPSAIEGIGMPMIESAICGCVPLTTEDNLTSKEFGFDEYSCKPNSDALAKKIIELVNIDLSEQISSKASLIEDKFQANNVAEKYLRIYENRSNRVSL